MKFVIGQVGPILLGMTCLVLLAGPRVYAENDCASQLTSSRMGSSDDVLILIAVGTVFEEAGAIVADGIRPDWFTFDPGQLAGVTPPGHTQTTMESLCEWLEAMPRPDQRRVVSETGEWIAAYRLVRSMTWVMSMESFATAIARNPDTRFLFPRGDDIIAQLSNRVGETLASAEYTALQYKCATYFKGLSLDERADTVIALLQTGVAVERGGQ